VTLMGNLHIEGLPITGWEEIYFPISTHSDVFFSFISIIILHHDDADGFHFC
jgi:hypothetical protein